MQFSKFVVAGLVALVIVGVVLVSTSTSPGNYDAFAKCLTEKGGKMYGAYWCPHCTNQKELFGNSWKYIDYVECDPQGAGARPSLCTAAGIRGFPTWEISGQKLEGEQTLQALSAVSGCPLK